MFCIFIAILITTVRARDVGMRAMPGVSDSIINLGKMDVSFYVNWKPEDVLHKHNHESSEIMKPCSCSHGVDDGFRFLDNLINSDSHQHPALSTKCCKKETDIIFTLTPKIHTMRSNSAQDIPFPLTYLINPSKMKLPTIQKINKDVELVLFPKRKDVDLNAKTTNDIKPKIKIAIEEKKFKKLDSQPVPFVNNHLDTYKVKDNTTSNKEENVDKHNL